MTDNDVNGKWRHNAYWQCIFKLLISLINTGWYSTGTCYISVFCKSLNMNLCRRFLNRWSAIVVNFVFALITVSYALWYHCAAVGDVEYDHLQIHRCHCGNEASDSRLVLTNRDTQFHKLVEHLDHAFLHGQVGEGALNNNNEKNQKKTRLNSNDQTMAKGYFHFANFVDRWFRFIITVSIPSRQQISPVPYHIMNKCCSMLQFGKMVDMYMSVTA